MPSRKRKHQRLLSRQFPAARTGEKQPNHETSAVAQIGRKLSDMTPANWPSLRKNPTLERKPEMKRKRFSEEQIIAILKEREAAVTSSAIDFEKVAFPRVV